MGEADRTGNCGVGAKAAQSQAGDYRRVLEISRAARSRDFKHARARLQAGYRRLLALVRTTVRDAERVMAEVASGARVAVAERGRNGIERGQAQIERMLPLVRRVMGQTCARIFKGDTHYRDKTFQCFPTRYRSDSQG